MSKQRKYRVFADVKPKPNAAEVSVAELVAEYLHADVGFCQKHKVERRIW